MGNVEKEIERFGARRYLVDFEAIYPRGVCSGLLHRDQVGSAQQEQVWEG
jgi:hypothetical protein